MRDDVVADLAACNRFNQLHISAIGGERTANNYAKCIGIVC